MNEARQRIKMTDAEIVGHFARLGYRAGIQDVVFTTESVDDYHEARLKNWAVAGKLKVHEPGLYIAQGVQPRPGRKTRDVVVVSLGTARAVLGVDPTTTDDRVLFRYSKELQ